jgi:hypothetical protein
MALTVSAMHEDLAKYNREVKAIVQSLFLNRDQVEKEQILDISDSFKVPCIVIAYWCGEVSGWPDYLKTSVDMLMKFYKYDEVKNKPEGCPW